MVLRVTYIFSLAFLFTACGSNDSPVDSSESTVEIPGKLLYEERCVQCHGFQGTDCLAGAADLSTSNLESDSIRIFIKEGKGAMPPFSSFITSDKEMDELVDYVKSLRK